MDTKTTVGARLVREHDLGFRRTPFRTNDSGECGKTLSVVSARAAQRGVEVGGRNDRSGHRHDSGCCGIVGRRDTTDGVASPGAFCVARMHLDPHRSPVDWRQLSGDPDGFVDREHLLHLDLSELKLLCGHSECFGTSGENHLGESRSRHDGLPVHTVVGQPHCALDADLALPQMACGSGEFDVGTEERVCARTRRRRCGRHPVAGVMPAVGRKVDQ